MTTATSRRTPSKNEFQFIFEFRNFLYLFTASKGLRTCSRWICVLPAFNSKQIHKKLVAIVRVVQNTQKLVISRCCFAENGKKCTEIYNARAQPLLFSLNFLFGDVLVLDALVVCLSSLERTIAASREKHVDKTRRKSREKNRRRKVYWDQYGQRNIVNKPLHEGFIMLCDLSFSVIRAKKAWKGLAFIIVLRLWRIFRVVISKYSIFSAEFILLL